MASDENRRFATGPIGPFATEFRNVGGFPATTPFDTDLIQDCSTLHKTPQQKSQRLITDGFSAPDSSQRSLLPGYRTATRGGVLAGSWALDFEWALGGCLDVPGASGGSSLRKPTYLVYRYRSSSEHMWRSVRTCREMSHKSQARNCQSGIHIGPSGLICRHLSAALLFRKPSTTQ